jgi:polyisoprenoid-binding protein YceI
MNRLATFLAAAGLAASVATSAQTPAPAAAAQAPAARPAQAPLGPNQWRIDGSHSAANFAVRHLMVSTVRGRLGAVSGTVEYDGKDVRSVKAEVTIDVTGIDTQNEKRDGHLRSPDFFDAPNHPNITFTSKRVEPGSAGAFKLIGDLTIRGTTKEVALDVEAPSPIVKGQRGLVTGTTATARIKRLEYGLKYNSMVEAGPVVGDEVTITIDLEIGRPSAPGTAAH